MLSQRQLGFLYAVVATSGRMVERMVGLGVMYGAPEWTCMDS